MLWCTLLLKQRKCFQKTKVYKIFLKNQSNLLFFLAQCADEFLTIVFKRPRSTNSSRLVKSSVTEDIQVAMA